MCTDSWHRRKILLNSYHCFAETRRHFPATTLRMELCLGGGAITSASTVACPDLRLTFSVFGKALHCLAKVGEEISVEATSTQV